MLFSSDIFLMMFLPLVLVLYFNPFIKNRLWKNMVLLFSSIAFYAWGEPFFIFFLIGATFFNYIFAMLMDKSTGKRKKFWLVLSLCMDMLLLGVFKYLTFLTENIAYFTGNESVIIDITLPIGISFFTFQMMSYAIDVYRGIKPQKNPLYVLLYVIMFPQLIAGPIVRYGTVAKEINERRESREEFTRGIIRFTYGLGKKVLISDKLAIVVDTVFNMTGNCSVLTAWLGAVCYTLQIYFDFSGYSDMAIGLGLIFGFHFPENFNYPYISKSVTEFWRRWHISLSSWFRDYVYIPLGGNRVSKAKWIRNMLAVWLLTGIWHGADWTFVIWGLIYFCVLVLEKGIGVKKVESHAVLSHLYTMVIVVLAWVVFRSDSLGQAGAYIGNMFGIRAGSFSDRVFLNLLNEIKFVLLYAIILSCPLYKAVKKKMPQKPGNWMEALLVLLIFILSMGSIVSDNFSSFIYFNF